MANKFSDGDRVTVSPDYHWAKNARGRIGSPPAQVAGLSGPWKDNLTRTVQTRKGPSIFYWVWFDEPQRDAEGYLLHDVSDGMNIGCPISRA